ncbi:MAG: ABC transporter substrate-binding protein [Deltaproteobacteria bacterium]|nr:ABC transporter substrate-binding protein [Deltaproteobacteria bacterium]
MKFVSKVLLFLAGFSAFAEIKILSVLPLTGPAASWGIMLNKAIQPAVNELNFQLKTIPEQITLKVEDTQCVPNVAVIVLKRAVAAFRPDIIIGGVCSGDVLAQAPIAKNEKIPFIVSCASSQEIRYAGDYIFRIVTSDVATASFAAKYESGKGYRKIHLITETTPYAIGLKNAFIKNLAPYVQITKDDFVTGERNFNSIEIKAKQSSADAVIINTQTPATNGVIAHTLKKHGVNNRIDKYVFYSKANKDLIKSAKGAHIGLFNIQPLSDFNDPQARRFWIKYRENFGEEPELPYYQLSAYDSVFYGS